MVKSQRSNYSQKYYNKHDGCFNGSSNTNKIFLEIPGLVPSEADSDDSFTTEIHIQKKCNFLGFLKLFIRYLKKQYKPILFYVIVTGFLTIFVSRHEILRTDKTWSETSWTELLTGTELQNPDDKYIQSQSPEIYEDMLRDLREMQRAASYLQLKQKAIETKTNKLEDEFKKISKTSQNEIITEAKVKHLINEALSTYDADKLGLRDYALESAGGSIVATPNTISYLSETRYVIFGIISYRVPSNPRMVLQPDIQPGNCFAFEGTQGVIRIKLANVIQVSAITLEHSPITLLTDEDIKSAPKDFQLMGLLDEEGNNKFNLGQFTYSIGGSAMQTFVIPNYEETVPVQFVDVIIKDNYGHPDYTCVYRVRIHGKRLVY